MKQLKLIVVWLWVAIPLGWGVMKSVQKALPLFSGNGTASAAPAR